MHPLSIGFLCATVFFLLLSVYFILILTTLSLSKNRKHRHAEKTLGYLKKIKTERNVMTGGYRGRPLQFSKHLSQATYFYYVNQRSYKISTVRSLSRRQMPSAVTVIYNKHLPFHARMEEELASREILALAFSLILFGSSLLIFLLLL